MTVVREEEVEKELVSNQLVLHGGHLTTLKKKKRQNLYDMLDVKQALVTFTMLPYLVWHAFSNSTIP